MLYILQTKSSIVQAKIAEKLRKCFFWTFIVSAIFCASEDGDLRHFLKEGNDCAIDTKNCKIISVKYFWQWISMQSMFFSLSVLIYYTLLYTYTRIYFFYQSIKLPTLSHFYHSLPTYLLYQCRLSFLSGPSLASFSFIFVFSNQHYNFHNK